MRWLSPALAYMWSFDKLAGGHKRAALKLMEDIASVLASRRRYANAEMRALED
jgi:hypothetical protein